MNAKNKTVLIIGGFIFFILLTFYSTNLGESQFIGYIVNTEYHSFPIQRTRITMTYGHPDTVSYAKFFSFHVYGYQEFKCNQFYKITCEATIFQLYKHIKKIELLEVS